MRNQQYIKNAFLIEIHKQRSKKQFKLKNDIIINNEGH